MGAITFSEEDRHLHALDMTLPENVELVLKKADSLWSNTEVRQSLSNVQISRASSSHGCGYEYLNVGQITLSNRQTIVDFYETFLEYEPDGNAGGATAGYWVGMVREGGPWDYKRDDTIGPYDHVWCCSYWRLINQHKTAEWLGNHNYGYTGSFLFTLDVLKAGSFAAALGDPADFDDWDAIEEGYRYSGGHGK